MRKGLKSRATFEFVNAPYEVVIISTLSAFTPRAFALFLRHHIYVHTHARTHAHRPPNRPPLSSNRCAFARAVHSRATTKVSSAAAEQAVGVGGQREGGRSWWRPSDADDESAVPTRCSESERSGGAASDGFDAAYDAIKAAVVEHKPDVLLGFSQGASSIALFLARTQSRDPDLMEGLQSVILIGGFLPQDQSWANEIATAPGPVPVRKRSPSRRQPAVRPPRRIPPSPLSPARPAMEVKRGVDAVAVDPFLLSSVQLCSAVG